MGENVEWNGTVAFSDSASWGGRYREPKQVCEEEHGVAEQTSLEDLVVTNNCGCGDDVLDGVNDYSGEEKMIEQQVLHRVEKLLADLFIVGGDTFMLLCVQS